MGNGCVGTKRVFPAIVDSVISDYEELYILCDKNGLILNISHNVRKILRYKLEDIENKFIGILMNKLLSFLHKKFFIPKLTKSSGIPRSKILNRLQTLTNDRPLIVYDINENPHCMNIQIIELNVDEITELYDSYNFIRDINNLQLDKTDQYIVTKLDYYKNKDNIATFMTQDNINNQLITISDNKLLFVLTNNIEISPVFNQTINNMVVITIDIMKSREILTTKGEVVLIDINRRLYDDVIYVIKTYFYPFIYIYEIAEDKFTLIINADWTYNIPLFCCTIGLYFVQLLFERTLKYININCGISYGKLSYGLIGNKLRLFGLPLVLSSLIKKKSNFNKFSISKSFYDKLLIEFNMIDNELYSDLDYTHNVELVKGFGNLEYYLVDNLLNRFKRAIN